MKIIYHILIIIFALQTFLIGQSDSILNSVIKNYESNNYDKSINLSNRILLNKESYSQEDLLKVYEIRAVCFYSKAEKDSSRNNFINALNLNNKYEPNVKNVSPKIINFFRTIKANYIKIVANNNEPFVLENKQKKLSSFYNKNQYINTTVLSMLAPGAGHLYSGNKTKGYFLLSASTFLLGSSAYYFFRTNNLEKKYINEGNKQIMEEKYKDYNQAYKIRNVLIISYATVWVFSQLDLFFLNPEQISIELNSGTSSITNSGLDIILSFNFKL